MNSGTRTASIVGAGGFVVTAHTSPMICVGFLLIALALAAPVIVVILRACGRDARRRASALAVLDKLVAAVRPANTPGRKR